jgi:predicted metal-dependent peptidase
MKLRLSEFFIHLITKKSFYGRLASSIERVARPGLGTLAVGIRDGRAVLYYDPEFLEAIPLKAALFALEHEMLHLVLDHIPRYLELLALCPTPTDRKKASAVYNISMDCAINTMLRGHEGFNEIEDFVKTRVKEKNPNLPEDAKSGMCLPEKFGLPLEGSFEFYQWSMMKKVKVIDVQFVGGTDHSMWVDSGEEGDQQGGGQGQGQGSGDKGDKEGEGFGSSIYKDMTSDELLSQAHRIREQLKHTMRQVVKSMGGVGRGTLPGNVEEWLEAYLADPIIPWWEIFATRAKMSRISKFRRSVALPNRALLALAEEDDKIIPCPGRTRDRAWRVFLYVDTSGSMSTESLEIVKSELQHMLAVDENMEIRYMQGDSVTQMDVVLNSGDEIPKAVMGRGGTDFNAYFATMKSYALDEAKAPDIAVVYTDGYAPAVDFEHRLPAEIPVIWLVTPNHSENFHQGYGEIIVCDPAQNKRYAQ